MLPVVLAEGDKLVYTYSKYFPIWKEAFSLAWPLILNHIFVTAMRTTDMILTGFISPAAVTAVGLGDVWERIVLRLGLGLGAGSISLISQESGAAAAENKLKGESVDEIFSQTILVGILLGLPFIFMGWAISEHMIAILGAEPEVIELGASYLFIIFAAAPFRLITLISARSLQGTGDTLSPMIVDIISNAANIIISVVLALGFWWFPRLGVIGVGWGTFAAKLLATLLYIGIFITSFSPLKLQFPGKNWDFTIVLQLIKVSLPRSLQGGYQSLITFPFNALVLLFGTEAAAAYHIARRIQQQLMAPLQRAFGTVTTIMAGQKMGAKKPEESRLSTRGMLWLTAITIGSLAVVLFIFSGPVVNIFTDDAVTISQGAGFLRALCVAAPLLTFYRVISGHLMGAGDTRTPFYGLVISQTLFKLVLSYLLAVILGLGLFGIFMGLVIDYGFQAGWVWKRFSSDLWVSEAEEMIAERRQ